MNDDPTTAHEDALDDLALRHALGELDGTERTQLETCMGCPHSRAASLVAGYREMIADVSVAAAVPSTPRGEVKEQVMSEIHSRHFTAKHAAALPHAVVAVTRSTGDLPWMPTPYRGVRMREISPGPDHAILMLDCAPGAAFPEHDHAGTEDVYILSGDAQLGDRHVRAGDFIHAESGTHHEAMITVGGCQALIITSRKNYSPAAARAYGIAHRVVSRIGRALGVVAKS